METDELVYSIDLDWDKIGFKSLKSSMDTTIANFAKITAVTAAASGAVFAFGKKMGDYGDALLDQAKQSNTSTQSLERLKFAAEQNKATYESLTSSLDNLATAQFEVLRGKGDFEAWGRIGINPSDYEDTADLLMAISDGVAAIDNQAEKINVIERLGISRDLLQTLEMGSGGLKDLGDEAERLGGISSQKFLKASEDFANGWSKASTVTSGVFKNIAGDLLNDTINPAIEAFTKFAKENMTKIVSTIKGIMNVIADVSKVIFSLIQRVMIQFDRLSSMLGGTENAIKALAAVFLILKRRVIMAMAPAILAVTALYLAFDEIMSFLEGEESFIGDFFKMFGIAGKDVKDVFSAIGDTIGYVIDLVKKLASIIGDALGGAMSIIKDVADTVGGAIDTVGGVASDIGGAIGEGLSATGSFIGSGIDTVGGWFGGDSSSGSTTNNTNQSVSIVVNGAGDAEKVAKEVKRQLDNSAKRAGY